MKITTQQSMLMPIKTKKKNTKGKIDPQKYVYQVSPL